MMFFRHPPDVTAVVLTTGEPTTQRALDSLHRQTTPISDIIVVRDIRPFHKALNAGARQVKTPFFIQVDADMVLDPNCVATLRKAMADNVGIAISHLRDPMLGQVVGIRMLRTGCFEVAEFPDSISPDTDFIEAIEHAGWQTVYVGERGSWVKDKRRTLGEHAPAFTPTYVYRKYLMEGRRHRYRGSAESLRSHLSQLEQSSHPLSFTAQVALSRGFFLESDRDALGREQGDPELERLKHFLQAPDPEIVAAADANLDHSLADRFRTYYRIGLQTFQDRDILSFHRRMLELDDRPNNPALWICKLALCRGMLATSSSDATVEADLSTLLKFLFADQSLEFLPMFDSVADLPRQAGPSRDEIIGYASSIGIGRFVIAPAAGGRNRASINPAARHGGDSGDSVVARFDAKGRPRIDLPFNWCGHIVCTEPERATGLFWCLDLLKAGYLFAHIPTPLGMHRATVPALIIRSLLDRGRWRSPPLIRRWMAAFSKMAGNRTRNYQPNPGVVLMVTESLAMSGSARQMVALSSGLLRQGYKVEVLSLTRPTDAALSVEPDLQRLGIEPAYVRTSALYPWADTSPAFSALEAIDGAAIPRPVANRILSIGSAIKRCRPEVVHGWLDGPGVAAALAGCAFGAPSIIVQQASISIQRRMVGSVELLRQGYRAIARNPAVTILNNSNAGARDNEKWIGLPSGRIGVVCNGFVPEFAGTHNPEDVARFRQSMAIPDDALVVGTVMRFVPEKGPGLWIDTAFEIARERPRVRFLIAGSGPLEDSIKHKIDDLGLRDRIAFVGPVDDAGLVYLASDVVLSTSVVEGSPNVMIEAQALGRAVVAPDVGGTREAVLDGVTGTIVRARTANALAHAVSRLLDDAAWRDRVRVEGPKFVASRFDLDRMIGETLAYYPSNRD